MQTLDGKFNDGQAEPVAPAPTPAPSNPPPPRPPLNRRSILDSGPRLVPLDVPEWGGQILLKPMSVSTMATVEEDRQGMAPLAFFPYLVQVSVCDDSGALLFDEKDRPALASKDFDVLKRVADAILKVNGMGPEDGDDAAKNS